MRDTLVLVALALLAGVVGILLYYSRPASITTPAAADTAAGTTVTEVPFTVLASGSGSTVLARANYRITSDAQLRELWKMLSVETPVPSIDFAANDVIAVFAGDEPTAGYAIAVAHVQDGAERNVIVSLTSPDATCVLAQQKTQPFEVVELPRTDLPMAHEDVATTTSCL